MRQLSADKIDEMFQIVEEFRGTNGGIETVDATMAQHRGFWTSQRKKLAPVIRYKGPTY